MKLSDTEFNIVKALDYCRFGVGSFDKKFTREMQNKTEASPLQQWWIHKLCYKYRKQINNDLYLIVSSHFLKDNPSPLSRKEAERIAKGKPINHIGEVINVKLPLLPIKSNQLSIFAP